MTTNCIKFISENIETAKGIGSISTLTFDLDITVEPVASSNPMAPRPNWPEAAYLGVIWNNN